MKSHRDVATEWAQNKGTNGREARGARMFYRGPTIYSYRTSWPIRGISRRTSTATCVASSVRTPTSTHKHHARAALGTYFAGPVFRMNPENVWHFDACLNAYLAHAREAREKIAKARRRKPEYVRELKGWVREMAAFAQFFGLDWGVTEETEFDAILAREVVERGE